MPLALTARTKISRAESLVTECRAMAEPPPGDAHGRWVVKMRSRLSHATRLIERKRYRMRDNFNAAERARANTLLQEIDLLYPKLRR